MMKNYRMIICKINEEYICDTEQSSGSSNEPSLARHITVNSLCMDATFRKSFK